MEYGCCHQELQRRNMWGGLPCSKDGEIEELRVVEGLTTSSSTGTERLTQFFVTCFFSLMYCLDFLQFHTPGSQLAFHHQTNSISEPTHFIFLEICACILSKGKGFKLLNLLPKGLQLNPQSVDLCLSLPLPMYPSPPCYLELLLLNSYVYLWLFCSANFFPLWESLPFSLLSEILYLRVELNCHEGSFYPFCFFPDLN